EEITVGEDDGDELTIRLAILLADCATVESDEALLRSVQARDQLDQSRLAAAVAPGKYDQLARPEGQVDGTEREAGVIVRVPIGERYTLQADRVAEREPPRRY